MRGLHNKLVLGAAVVFSLLIITLVVGKLTHEETQTVPAHNAKTATDENGPSNEAHETQIIRSAEPAFSLAFPVACRLGEDCWVARYVDRQAGAAAADHSCGASTQNGHKGTDIAISDLARMEAGVSVLAPASGIVLRIRDGVEDVSVRETGAEDVNGMECGNGLVLDHGNGWQTQYCHLKQGSLAVRNGDKVMTGDVLGQVGMSGLTEYPHLHFTARLNSEVVDPFDGGKLETHCDADGQSLWRDNIPYQAFIPLPAQFSITPKNLKNMWQPGLITMPSDSPVMLLVGRGFRSERGDIWHFTITDPKGNVMLKNQISIEKSHQIYVGYMGLRQLDGGFKPGIWKGRIHIDRGPGTGHDQMIEIEVTP